MPLQIIAVTVLGHDRPGIIADVTAASPAWTQPRGLHDDPAARPLRDGRCSSARSPTPAQVEAALKPLTAGGSLVINARVLAESTDHDSRRSGVLAAGARRGPPGHRRDGHPDRRAARRQHRRPRHPAGRRAST